MCVFAPRTRLSLNPEVARLYSVCHFGFSNLRPVLSDLAPEDVVVFWKDANCIDKLGHFTQ
jgi:hypothetical protein